MFRLVEKLYAGENLSTEEARKLILSFLSEEADPVYITAALVALKIKGEMPQEITGAAQAMLEKAVLFPTGGTETLDTCGTGGDGHATVNISTASAIIAAEAGCAVVKHGNRSVSSKSGSADILEQLGLPLVISQYRMENCLKQVGICFLFAPNFHPAVKTVMPIRKALRTRTIFNILGPLVNPARPAFQVMGVFQKELCRPIAETLLKLGTRRALVVHGSGLDELAMHGKTCAVLLDRGEIKELEFFPEQFGLLTADLEAIKGGLPEENAHWLKTLLQGKASLVHRQAVALNAGAAIWIAGKSSDMKQGIETALEILNSDRGWNRFQRWVEVARGT